MENQFIEGIFNYCDAWCDRCAFRDRCRNFQMRVEMERHIKEGTPYRPLAADLDGETEEPPEWFEEIPDLLSDEEVDEQVKSDRARRKNLRETEPALMYAVGYSGWFEEISERLDRMRHAAYESPAQAEEFGALEVIFWDAYLIQSKVMRALEGLGHAKESDDDDDRATHIYDARGSAKVAYISMNRSLKAWRKLLIARPKMRAPIFRLAGCLKTSRAGLLAAIPDLQSFRRPGFDSHPA